MDTPFVGFSTMEELAADLALDGVTVVRVATPQICEGSNYGVALYRCGVVVAARVGGEIRYAFVNTGLQQKTGEQILAGEQTIPRTEAAYQAIVAWLEQRGFVTRTGLFSMPRDLRLMLATADCLQPIIQAEKEQG